MSEMNQNHAPDRYQEESPGKRQEESRTRSRRRKRRPIWLTIIIRFFQVLGTLLLIGVVTGAFLACYAAVYVKTAVMPRAHLDLSAYTLNENSVIYYEDKETGEWKELQTLVGTENREWVDYNDIPQDLINAFVAIEDKRFWSHDGVDWRRTGAGLIYMFTGRSIQGGSTITQQLIKNLTEYDDVTVTRKILEIFTALDFEDSYDKEVILTWYFNKIYLGNGCFGVQAASQFYFGKDVWDLSLAECASLAGITNNPSLYAPYGIVDVTRYTCRECGSVSLTRDDACESCGAEHSFDNGVRWTNREYNKARQELILEQMADPEISPDGAYITEARRDAAIAETLVFTRDRKDLPDDGEDPGQETAAPSSVNSWYVDAVISEVINALREQTGMTRDMCSQLVYSGGLRIYVPFDPDVQAAVDAVYNDRASLDYTSRTGQQLQSAITVVDNSTGYVVAMAGAVGEKTVNLAWNNALATRQPGSSIKPLSVYSPAIEMGLITPASVSDDNPRLLNGQVWPTNAPPGYNGLMSILDALTVSKNTVALNVLEMVTPQMSYEYMTERYGFTTLEPYYVNNAGEVKSDIDSSPLAMGGLTWGLSTFEMAAAYATFPRNGGFTPATTFLRVEYNDGRTLIDNTPKTDYVIKPSTAYYMNSMLTNVVSAGTGYMARIPGQTVAGKTGTTNNEFDLWFCGYTSYYTAAVWVGYPQRNEKIVTRYGPAMTLWQQVMARIHEGLENRPFPTPDNLTTYNICADCGNLATANCANDIRGSRERSFRLISGDGPTQSCTCHVPVKVCTDSPILNANGEPTGRYHLAGEFCPEESVKEFTMVDYSREVVKASVKLEDADAMLSFYDDMDDPTCDVHLEEEPPEESEDPEDPDASQDPEESGQPVDPTPSGEPTPSEPPVISSEPPAPPPSEDPVVLPSEEPPAPPPSEEPQPAESEEPYIPVDDPLSEDE